VNVADQNSGTPAPVAQDPSEDNLDATQADKAQNTPAAPDETLERTRGQFNALQAEYVRRYPGQALPPQSGDLSADYKALQKDWTQRNQQRVQPPEPETPESYKEKWAQSETTRALAVYGPQVQDAVDAYNAAYDQDPSPFGAYTALEIYFQKRLEQETKPVVQQTQQTKGQALAPRVDSNRSDVSPDLAVTSKSTEARRGDKFLEQGIAGLLKQVPWGNR
jgi:hypothetical protein